ncbi:MAG: hypothetical protein ABI442_16080 [Gemmatimonadaceae bacterium]
MISLPATVAAALAIRQPTKHATARHDALTVAAVAVIVYALSSLLHEGVGHGGACLLVGAKPIELSSMHFECSVLDDGLAPERIVAAGGTIATLIGGALAMLLYKILPGPRVLRYALWLFAAVNLMQGTGYFFYSGVSGIGDWAAVIGGLEPEVLWRSGITVVGLISYLLVTKWVFLALDPFVGDARPRKYQHATRLGLIPYFAGAALEVAAGAFNAGGLRLVLISGAAASLGGTSGLVWGPQTLRGETTPSDMLEIPVTIVERSWLTILLAAVVAVGFVAIFGKGLSFAL